ncbi:MAG: YdbH domain-containing protein [Novosphingobium sp.]
MAESREVLPDSEDITGELPAPARRRAWAVVLGALGLVLIAALAVLWLNRDTIAGNVIAGQLKQMGVPATYRIESIGPQRQVLTNILVGDPAHPDLTIERAEVEIEPRFGTPTIGRVTLLRPRLYGSYRGGKLSFGKLDTWLFKPSTTPFRLPDLDLSLIDGRALLLTDSGAIGAKLEGAGPLRSGFAGIVALTAPELTAQACRASKATLYGKLSVSAEQPRFVGPLRLAALDCPASGMRLRQAGAQIDATFDKGLRGAAAQVSLATGTLGVGGVATKGLNGSARLTYRQAALVAQYDLTGHNISAAQASAANVAIKGQLRGQDGLRSLQADGTLSGSGLALGSALDGALASAQRAGEGSLAAPLLARLRGALAQESRGSSLSGDFALRRANGSTSLVIPQAALRGGSGNTLLAISRMQWVSGGGAPRLAGNFTTGGEGLPRMTGRMDRDGRGATTVRMTMAEYTAGPARLALPELVVAQAANGGVGFTGRALASGPLPGGSAQGLELPLDGSWTAGGGLAMWRGCRNVRFAALSYANLTLDRRDITLCPGGGGAILRSGPSGLAISAGATTLNLTGRLGETPVSVASGPFGVAKLGRGAAAVHAGALDIALGPVATAARFRLASLDASLGSEVGGSFSGTDVLLNGVPLDVLGASGQWRYQAGRLDVTGATFQVQDRQQVDRFKPLIARDGVLSLADNHITASARLREPTSDRALATVSIVHDLKTASGHADLAVADLQFDSALQPDTLSPLALGVIANARGSVNGTGRIDWNQRAVTSSGEFATTGLDFAAAFGPVKGLAGTVRFTDLLGLITAPDQQLTIASINPGIAVEGGVLSFEMRPASVLMINGASWPFLDGRMTLLPTRMVLGAAELRRYELKVEGISAAKFVEKMELANMAATGTFDGSLPLVFDANGGRIEGGVLTARPPGGNVSYVGALTYKDMGAMANFAFQALRSLDYKQMRVAMDGDLEGELVTRVRFDGVTQGQGAKRNLITRQLSRLPIRFNINVRAPFYQLISSFKAMYDPAYTADPRSVGLLDAQGKPVSGPKPAAPPILPPSAKSQNIQPPVSENKR